MKTSFNLLLSIEEASTPKDGAQLFFAASGLDDFEERWSDNYPGGSYFVKRAGGMTYRFMEADDSKNPDRRFWARLEFDDDHAGEFDLDHFVRERLLVKGFQVSNMIRYGRVGEERRDF